MLPPAPGSAGLCALRSQLAQRIDGLGALAQFEMQLRGSDIAALADAADDLAALYLIAALDQKGVAMGIGGDPAIGMADQQQIAEAAQLVAGIDDDATVGGAHRRAQGGG